MSEAKAKPWNFIRQIIDEDIAEGKYRTIRTRFPPEPNGYLHIGHAKSICLNFGIAEDCKGQCRLRFDDTNPEKEDLKYIDSIKYDVQWLGFEWAGGASYSSDYFGDLYHYAIELIEKDLAYVEELTPHQIHEYRGTLNKPGRESPYRDRSVTESLRLFKKMREGGFREGEACLRTKIDMASPFMLLRDPVIYRVRFSKHHQTKDKWCIYPMYDFAQCISDAIEGITHSLCTLEFQDNRRLYDWVLENVSVKARPRQYEFSRLNLEYTVMSKRKLSHLVSEKLVSGWDDPRMPTISGLRRRGFTAASIREFCKRIGVTKQESMIEFSSLESCARDDLNKNAPRAMAILDPVKVVIENFERDSIEVLSLANHPYKSEMGRRKVPLTREIWIEREDFRETAGRKYKRLVLGRKVRLRGAYVIQAERVEKNSNGEIITIFCRYDSDTLNKNPADGGKVKCVIHWVSVDCGVPAEIRCYDHLFVVPNPGSTEDFTKIINPNSVVKKRGYIEPNLRGAQAASHYQFERVGFFCKDGKDSSPDLPVFNRTVALRGKPTKGESS